MTIDWKKVAADAWSASGSKAAAIEYHRDCTGHPLIIELEPKRLKRLRELLKNSISLSRAYYEISGRRHGGAPQPTVEALMYLLCERGMQGLEEAATRRRLFELGEQQLHEICGRLQRLKPHTAPAWPPEQITVLVDAWNNCHG